MTVWDKEKGEHGAGADVEAFLNDLIAVCRKHGMSLGHEDHHGAFEVYRQVHPDAIDWLRKAHVAQWR